MGDDASKPPLIPPWASRGRVMHSTLGYQGGGSPLSPLCDGAKGEWMFVNHDANDGWLLFGVSALMEW